MEGYACSPDGIPKFLYRVHYPGAQVEFSSQSGFSAKDKTRTFSDRDLEDFARAIEYQFTWGYREPLPFISLFSDLKHAQNWGCKTPWSPDITASPPWTLYTIDTASISTTHTFFKLRDIVDTLRLTIPQSAQQHIKGAFVCLHGIPTSAIQESSTHTEVKQARESRGWSPIMEERDSYDYLGEYGNDDSDREMVQENLSSIIEKNIEDGW